MTNKFGLLYEAIQTEPFELVNAGLADQLAGVKYDLDISNDVENDDLLDDLDSAGSLYDDELDQELDYTAEMVNILAMPYKGKEYACIEASDLLKYLKVNDLEVGNIGDAIAQIAAKNGVEVNNIAIVMESNRDLNRMITEAKQTKGVKSLGLLKTFANLAKNAKNQGLKVLKKKSKK